MVREVAGTTEGCRLHVLITLPIASGADTPITHFQISLQSLGPYHWGPHSYSLQGAAKEKVLRTIETFPHK